MGCFPVDFQEVKRPLRTKSMKRPIKVGKRPINEGKRPTKAKVLVGVSVGCLMGCFWAPPPCRKTAPLKRPIKRSMNAALSPCNFVTCREKQLHLFVTPRPPIWQLSFCMSPSLSLRNPWNAGPSRNAASTLSDLVDALPPPDLTRSYGSLRRGGIELAPNFELWEFGEGVDSARGVTAIVLVVSVAIVRAI